ncbi:MAG: hypothetical protein MRQ07_02565 [Candidatus Midichloria sp.]|nr:hypothetical protein [Candidatus Midichloria sp.]
METPVVLDWVVLVSISTVVIEVVELVVLVVGSIVVEVTVMLEAICT